jgi:hypothetical protein
LQRNATLSVTRLLKSIYLRYFSQPSQDRPLYKAVLRRPVRSMVELGIGSSARTKRLLEIASWKADARPLRYTGIDLFEARATKQAGMSLKEAFAELRLPDVKTQLVPGDPNMALRRVANSLTGTDLLLVADGHDSDSLEAAWNWMPRMLTESSLVFIEEPGAKPGTMAWRQMSLADVQKLAASAGRSLRRAA